MLQKVIQLKLLQIKLAKKLIKVSFDLVELKNTVKNNKIKTIRKDLLKSKNTTKNNKNKDINCEVKAKKYYDYDDIEYEGIKDMILFKSLKF